MSDQLNWDRVLTYECWIFPEDKEKFLTGRAQKIAAGIYGNTLILVLGGNSNDHSYLLRLAHENFSEEDENLPTEPEWAGGAFIEYLNKAGELNIWGDSTTLDGSLPEKIQTVAIEEFSQLDWIDVQ